jgi:hypothetical protein
MSAIVAKRLVQHLERSGFVVMKKPAIGGGAALGRGYEPRCKAGPGRSSSPMNSLSLARARLRRLLMVPVSTLQMTAASSYDARWRQARAPDFQVNP